MKRKRGQTVSLICLETSQYRGRYQYGQFRFNSEELEKSIKVTTGSFLSIRRLQMSYLHAEHLVLHLLCQRLARLFRDLLGIIAVEFKVAASPARFLGKGS